MRIDVETRSREFDDQTRAYAEFRVFATLARFSAALDHARVSLTHRAAGLPVAVCVIDVTLADGTRARVSARGGHAYGAIDRAADRANDLLRGHAHVALQVT